MQRVRVFFAKGDEARFLSHLDLMATFEYGLRRAKLPFELSEGFNPRPRMSIASPLPLGYVGEREILELALREPMAAQEIVRRLQAALPAGITILSAEEYATQTKSSASRVRGAVYRMTLPEAVDDLPDRVAALLARPTLEVEEERDGTRRKRNLRPLIKRLEAPDGRTLLLDVRLDRDGTARPEQVLDLLSILRDGVRIARERIELERQ
jgi:radical SAM-linked protein